MKYRDLFELENHLSSNLAETIHVEVEKETTYEKAFNVTGPFKDNKAKGLYIIVFCEDEAEAIYLWNVIKNTSIEFKEDNSMLQTISENGDYRLIIAVNEH
jgi:hypothetical protein